MIPGSMTIGNGESCMEGKQTHHATHLVVPCGLSMT